MSEWILVNSPLPEDEKYYDIQLFDGTVIHNVEYWAFGGGWKPAERSESVGLVHYPYYKVEKFRETKG